MLTSLLARTTMALLPAAAGPVGAILVPVLVHLITQREFELRITLR